MTDRDGDGVSAQGTPSRSGGRPEYKPTDEQRALVRRLRLDGQPIGSVAKAVGVSRNTLRKHFADDLAVTPAPIEQQLELGGEHHATAVVVEPAAAPGRPEFEPTSRQRDDVCRWAGDDWSEDRMARQLGISRNTLRKHFADEIQFGADRLRTKVLRNLERDSNAGKVAASNRLLTILDRVAPPPPPRGGASDDDESPEPPLGKKAQAKVDAGTAAQDTDWAELMH